MNKTAKTLCFGVLSALILFCVILSVIKVPKIMSAESFAAEQSLKTVVVDAGHGGIDPGAVSAEGIFEKDINLSVSECLSDFLNAFGYNVIMTRSDDNLIGNLDNDSVRDAKRSDIKKRLEISEQAENSILLSIHQNKFSNPKYSGTQVFYSSNNPLSNSLACCIQSDVSRLLQPQNDRQIKAVGKEIYLLFHSQKPAVMVECCFISNADELSDLLSAEYQKKLCFCILNGVLDFDGTSD